MQRRWDVPRSPMREEAICITVIREVGHAYHVILIYFFVVSFLLLLLLLFIFRCSYQVARFLHKESSPIRCASCLRGFGFEIPALYFFWFYSPPAIWFPFLRTIKSCDRGVVLPELIQSFDLIVIHCYSLMFEIFIIYLNWLINSKGWNIHDILKWICRFWFRIPKESEVVKRWHICLHLLYDAWCNVTTMNCGDLFRAFISFEKEGIGCSWPPDGRFFFMMANGSRWCISLYSRKNRNVT